MRISFVIPAYNEALYLGACLRAVLNEAEGKPYPVEVIVVNNASTDETRHIAASFPGVTVVDEPRKGLLWARQAGHLASSGEVIANVDADALVPPGWLDVVVQEFQQDPRLVALSGPVIHYDLPPFRRLLVRAFFWLSYPLYLVNRFVLRVGSIVQGGNFAVRRDALDAIGGYNLDLSFYGEDADIARRLHRVGHVKFTFRLTTSASARRLMAEGTLSMGWRYFLNYLWIIFLKRPLTNDYIDVR